MRRPEQVVVEGGEERSAKKAARVEKGWCRGKERASALNRRYDGLCTRAVRESMDVSLDRRSPDVVKKILEEVVRGLHVR